MNEVEKNGVRYLTFPELSRFSELWHGVFTRHHGSSTGSYASLNTSFGMDDDSEAVAKNRRSIARCIGTTDVAYVNQNHGVDIVLFRKGGESGTPIARNGIFAGGGDGTPLTGDALLSNVPGKFLAVQVADCQSVLLYDPRLRVVGNIHAGWRGSARQIIGRTVDAMNEHFNSEPAHIHAAVGPSLGPCCAEFINYRKELPEAFWKFKDGQHRFDFWSITLEQLTSAGIMTENISFSRICTKCNTDLFYSYRGEGTTGRFASVIGLI
jgi:YfiH family protein